VHLRRERPFPQSWSTNNSGSAPVTLHANNMPSRSGGSGRGGRAGRGSGSGNESSGGASTAGDDDAPQQQHRSAGTTSSSRGGRGGRGTSRGGNRSASASSVFRQRHSPSPADRGGEGDACVRTSSSQGSSSDLSGAMTMGTPSGRDAAAASEEQQRSPSSWLRSTGSTGMAGGSFSMESIFSPPRSANLKVRPTTSVVYDG